MSRQQKELFLFPNYKIFVVEGRGCKYFFTVKNGHVCYAMNPSCDAVDIEFSNRRLSVLNHKMLGRLSNLKEGQCKSAFVEARYTEKKYPNFLDIKGEKLDSALESIKTYLKSENWTGDDNNTWIIIPIPAKKLSGKKFDVEFNLCPEDFSYGNDKKTLSVYMSDIKVDTREIKYSVEIPDYLYDYLMIHPEQDKRPKSKVYTTNVFSMLHEHLSSLCGCAQTLTDIDKELAKAKKVILVRFGSAQTEVRDDYAHGYAGKSTSINYQFFIGYEMTKSNLSGEKCIYVDSMWTAGKGYVALNHSERKIPIGKVGGYKILDWSKEREKFLTSIEIDFKKLSDGLNIYLSDLNDTKLDLLIANNPKLLN